MHWPKAFAYPIKTSFITCTSFFDALQNNNESLAKSKWVIVGALLHIETPRILPSFSALASRDVKPSAH